ncbi:MAG: ABC transporter ATP-binding protein [Desulfomonilia bacterium]
MMYVRNINTYYGALHIIKNLSLHVGPGEIVVVLGANGSGKSTLLSALAGITPARDGEVIMNGVSILGKGPKFAITNGISLVSEDRGLFNTLTVWENVALGLAHRGLMVNRKTRSVIEEGLKIFPQLASRRTQVAGTLSGGEQQMLAIARSLVAKPRLLLLDELSSGLAPNIVKHVLERIRHLSSDQGTSILLVEQNGRLALDIAERGYVMETGKLVFSGYSKDLRDNPEIVRAYLGGSGGRNVFREQ